MSAQLNRDTQINAIPASQLTQIPQSEIGSEIEKLTEQSVLLEKQLSELESRIGPVLSQRATGNSQGATGAPEPVRTPLAETLHERTKHLSSSNEQLASIIARIAL